MDWIVRVKSMYSEREYDNFIVKTIRWAHPGKALEYVSIHVGTDDVLTVKSNMRGMFSSDTKSLY